jgi:hypothetical protein
MKAKAKSKPKSRKHAKKTLYGIPVNKNLLWDYDWSAREYGTEKFFKWYLTRVLSNGTAKDINSIDYDIIKKYLKELNLARRLARFWFHYLGINEEYKYGNIERFAD